MKLCSKIVEERLCGVTQFAPTSEGPVLSLFNTSLRFSPGVEQLRYLLKPEKLGAGPEPGGGGRRSTLFHFDTKALQSLSASWFLQIFYDTMGPKQSCSLSG